MFFPILFINLRVYIYKCPEKIIDFPEIENISTLDYYELLLSGK